MPIVPRCVVTMFCLIALPALARAQQDSASLPPPAGDSAFEDLGLTVDQRSKIQAIHERVQQENAPLGERAHQILGGRSFRDLTPAQRDSLRPQLAPIHRQMMENVRKAREQIGQILTPEQRRKFAQALQGRRRSMQDST